MATAKPPTNSVAAVAEQPTMVQPETSHNTAPSANSSPKLQRRRSGSITSGQGQPKMKAVAKKLHVHERRNSNSVIRARSSQSIGRNDAYNDNESSFVDDDGPPGFQDPQDIYGAAEDTQRTVTLQHPRMQKSVSSPAPRHLRTVGVEHAPATKVQKSRARLNALDEP